MSSREGARLRRAALRSGAPEPHSPARRSTAKMVINRNIWTVAAWLIAKHGEAAPKVVSARISKLREGEVESSAITSWLQVDQAVYELTRAPAEDERIN